MTEGAGSLQNGEVLELLSVSKRFGSLVAVNDVSLAVRRGDRHALIGPNGAGKSTLFHLIAGMTEVSQGRVIFQGMDVTRLKEHRRACLGIARTFQRSSLFDRLSALDNITLAVQRPAGVAHKLFRSARGCREVTERANELLERVALSEQRARPAGQLSHGERRQLEVALALAADPVLILMDEPTAGMSKEESIAFLDMVARLSDSLTILIVEHDMDVVFGLANRVSVLDAGKLLADGTPPEIRDSAAVQEAYLGRERMQLFKPS